MRREQTDPREAPAPVPTLRFHPLSTGCARSGGNPSAVDLPAPVATEGFERRADADALLVPRAGRARPSGYGCARAQAA